MTRAQVLGIEMVLSDGEVLDHLNMLPKDNTGPDVTSLALGSEGTLGIITAVRVQLHTPRIAAWTALVPVDSVEAAIEFCSPLLPQLLAAELFGSRAAGEVAEFKSITPLNSSTAWWLLVEGDADLPVDALPDTTLVATQPGDAEKFWMYRELQTEVIAHHDDVVKLDVSVGLSELGEFVRQVHAIALEHGVLESHIYFFGHVMDGNLHISLAKCARQTEVADAVIALVVEAGGAISAEHGIGQTKNQYLPLVRTGRELELFWSVRRAFDPAGLMNPHVLCRTEK
jgi:FAD/FMN-containing dehydrogenase